MRKHPNIPNWDILLKCLNRYYQPKVRLDSSWNRFYVDDVVIYACTPYINISIKMCFWIKVPADCTRSRFWFYFRHCQREEKVGGLLGKIPQQVWHSYISHSGSGGPQNYYSSGTDPFVSIIIICLGLQKPSALAWSCTLMWSNGTPIHWNPNLLSFSPEGKLYYRAIKEK